MQNPTSRQSGKLEGLNALRGAAVLLVLYFHFIPGGVASPEFTAFTGVLGIVLFFFLSGFFMDRTLAHDRNVWSFALKRAARILPLYWFSLAVAFIIGNWTLYDLFANAAFLIPFTRTDLMSGVYWTLYIEIAFYVVVPVIALSGRRATALSLYAAVALDAAVAAIKGQPSHTLYYMTFCLAGMQFGLWHRELLATRYLALAVTAAVVHAAVLADKPVAMGLAAAISSAAVFIGLHYDTRARTWLSSAGDISYSLYLLHAVIGLQITRFMLDAGLGAWMAAAGGVVVSIAVSAVTYRAIEWPFMWAAHKAVRR